MAHEHVDMHPDGSPPWTDVVEGDRDKRGTDSPAALWLLALAGGALLVTSLVMLANGSAPGNATTTWLLTAVTATVGVVAIGYVIARGGQDSGNAHPDSLATAVNQIEPGLTVAPTVPPGRSMARTIEAPAGAHSAPVPTIPRQPQQAPPPQADNTAVQLRVSELRTPPPTPATVQRFPGPRPTPGAAAPALTLPPPAIPVQPRSPRPPA
jgi:hypothetical protein